MAYKGGVPVNSGFYPRNDFPIAEAKDIYVSDEQRLDKIIEIYTLNIDYNTLLAFDITEIVFGSASGGGADNEDAGTSSVLGVAVLGQMVLG